MKKTNIPFGPQHPVLPEPLHLDLVLEDEKVLEAVPSIGYIHRGLELLTEKIEFPEFVYVAERICGICSFMHGMGYCCAVEDIMKLDVPARARSLRVFWAELSRIHSHLLWLGLAADAFGFENLFMQTWRLREKVLDIFEKTTGGRVIFGVCKVGGVKRDVGEDQFKEIMQTLGDLKKETEAIAAIFLQDFSVRHRLCGLGVLTREDAQRLGAVGPMLRASGISYDLRQLKMPGYYDQVAFEPVTAQSGDCLARCEVRINEIYQSIDIIRQVVEKISRDPAIDCKVAGNPNGESFMRLEQPRGEVLYFVRGNGTRNLSRYRARTPTFANIPAVIHLLKGVQLADVPTIILTIDPCISCTER